MIPQTRGLVAADFVILMFLGEHRWRIAAPPTTIAINTPLSSSHTNRRCTQLVEIGLLEIADDRGYYRITDLGIRYINGAISEEELVSLIEDADLPE